MYTAIRFRGSSVRIVSMVILRFISEFSNGTTLMVAGSRIRLIQSDGDSCATATRLKQINVTKKPQQPEKTLRNRESSFPRKRESSAAFWTPAFAGVTMRVALAIGR